MECINKNDIGTEHCSYCTDYTLLRYIGYIGCTGGVGYTNTSYVTFQEDLDISIRYAEGLSYKVLMGYEDIYYNEVTFD